MRTLLALWLIGCAGSYPKPTVEAELDVAPFSAPQPAKLAVRAAAPIPAAPAPVSAARAVDAPSAADLHSVRFTTNTAVRAEPSATATRIGVIGKGARARATAALPPGDGCPKRWIAIAPRGWACEASLEPSPDEPTAPSTVSLHAEDEPELGAYGAVRGKDTQVYANRDDVRAGAGHAIGTASVRMLGVTVIDGTRYWVTAGGLIEERAIAQMSPSRFHGVPVDDGRLHVAWAHAHGKPREPVVLRGAPGAKAEVTGELSPRARVSVKEVSGDGHWVRVTDTDWAARADLRVASVAAPPPGTGADERWFDVDRDEQILVAYEGTRPVYATLVSTGKWDRPTPEEIGRVASKLRTADMTSTKVDVYSVADVPWTMFYDNNFALHTSYWHDGFGDVRSHGCVNLAPRDARILYQWSSPDVPPGWIAVYGDAQSPGSLVRVRSHDVPEPAFRGYAKALHDQTTTVATR